MSANFLGESSIFPPKKRQVMAEIASSVSSTTPVLSVSRWKRVREEEVVDRERSRDWAVRRIDKQVNKLRF